MTREHWSSRLGFILAALGSAIGLGTLWKFPYVTGENGGGIFVLFYLFFTLFLGIPLFIAELLLGRKAQAASVGVFAHFSPKQRGWRGVGWLAVLSSFFILSYYCVVAGWGLNYLLLSLSGFYETQSVEQIPKIFQVLFVSGDISLLWAALFLVLTFGVIYRGVQKGIEFWTKILTIALLILLVALVIYAATLSGFPKAISFLFSPNWRNLKPSGILEALGLSLFTLSLAQGVILTYGSYLKKDEDLPKTALIVGLTVIIVSILAVLLIFPVIFTFDLPHQEGAGLIFKTLPVLFARLPGSMLLSTLFFTLFVFTALTSAIALLEVVAANLIDLYGWKRHKAVFFSMIAVFIVAIPSALSGAHDLFAAWPKMYGMDFFGSLDALVSNWFLPIGAFFTSIYVGWALDQKLVKREFRLGTNWKRLYSLWIFLLRWFAPIAILAIFLQSGGFINFDSWFGSIPLIPQG